MRWPFGWRLRVDRASGNMFTQLLIGAWQRSGHPVIGFGPLDKRAVKHFPARVDINHRPIKFPADHFAGKTVDDDGASSGGRNVGASHDCWLNFIPRQCAISRGESVRVSLTRPRRLMIPSGRIVPDERPSVSGMLVGAATIRAVGKQQQQRSANEKTSRGHGLLFSQLNLQQPSEDLTRSKNQRQDQTQRARSASL